MNNVFTHKGWFFLCPVWVNPKTCQLVARFWILEWWFTLNQIILIVTAWLISLFYYFLWIVNLHSGQGELNIDPVWRVRKLKQPKIIDVR